MIKSYWDHVKSGDLTPGDAMKYQAVRQEGRVDATARVKAARDAGEPVVFGWLDVIAVFLVTWYGPVAAGEVFRHYAGVCERRGDAPGAPK